MPAIQSAHRARGCACGERPARPRPVHDPRGL